MPADVPGQLRQEGATQLDRPTRVARMQERVGERNEVAARILLELVLQVIESQRAAGHSEASEAPPVGCEMVPNIHPAAK